MPSTTPTNPAATGEGQSARLDPWRSPAQLASMALHGGDIQRWEAAAHPNTPPQVLSRLSRDPALLPPLLDNPSLPQQVLAEIVERHATAAMSVANHPNCGPALCARLSCHPAPAVREAIARKARCPGDVLDALAQDSDPRVRAAAAAHPDCSDAAKVAGALMGFTHG